MADFGFKVSQDSFDVKSCADSDLVMSSSFNMLKTALVGSSAGPATIAHGLAYTPILFTSQQSGGFGSMIGDDNQTSIDSTNVNIPSGVTVKYYVFYQQGV